MAAGQEIISREPNNRVIHMLRRIAANLRQISSGDLALFGGAKIDAAVAGRIRAEQINTVVRYMPWMMVANVANAFILLAAFWKSPDRALALIWTCTIIAFAAFHWIRNLRNHGAKPLFVSVRAIRRAVRNAFLLGNLWAALPLIFFPAASNGGQLIITCICAGMLCGGAFAWASIPVAAIAFTSPIFLASAIAIGLKGDPAYVLVAMLMVVYTCVLLRGVFVHALELTNRLIAQIKVEMAAREDALTNLPNRLWFSEELENAFSRLRRFGEHFAILYLDLDGFKSVNDKLGHAAGDELLIQVADRLRSTGRDTDAIARYGGDEFTLVAADVSKPEVVLARAERIVKAFDLPFIIGGSEIAISVSIGIALAPLDGIDSHTLLNNADVALYRAKKRIGGSIHFFEPRHDAKALKRRSLELDLQGALQRHEFELVFQPFLDLVKNRITGCEALLRWNHPTRGLVLPEEFIKIAEETQLIESIGEWVIHEACRTAANWPKDTRVAVNCSIVQFRNHRILPVIVKALADARIAPSRLEIEITESVFISESESALSILNALHELGVKIALDDFGTGYSSLSYLRKLPLDRVKIDRSFIHDLLTRSDSASIINFVIGLAGDLGMSVTAEGVETREQLSYLRTKNCGEIQGFLISVPKPASEIAVLIRDQDITLSRAA
jgi:diguanylate cyclase (GGDEF)-like protein